MHLVKTSIPGIMDQEVKQKYIFIYIDIYILYLGGLGYSNFEKLDWRVNITGTGCYINIKRSQIKIYILLIKYTNLYDYMTGIS